MKKTWNIIHATFSHWHSHSAPRMGAALSYYALFSIIPLLILIITLVALIYDRSVVEGSVITQINGAFGSDLGAYIETILESADLKSRSLATGIISGVFAAIGAIGVFNELNQSLDELWSVKREEVKRSFFRRIAIFFKEKLVSFSIVPIAGLLLLFSISFNVFLSFFGDANIDLPIFGNIFKIAELLTSFILTTALFALVYKMLPNTKLPWREILLGAFISAILFLVGRFLIILYLHTVAQTALFGPASALVIFLIWIYYSAQIFLIGASFIFVYSKRHGALSKVR